jgi:sec-independent protein translocase protein TatA
MLPLALLDLGFGEMVLIAIIALLVYGSDLPDMARSWGKTYQEFRRHLNGIRNDLNTAMYSEPESPRKLQYYPEYHSDVADVVDSEPAEHDSPVAQAAEEAERQSANSPDAADLAVTQDAQQHDAHGAA